MIAWIYVYPFFIVIALLLLQLVKVLRSVSLIISNHSQSQILRLAYDEDLRKIPGPWLLRFTRLSLKSTVINETRTSYINDLYQKYGRRDTTQVRTTTHNCD